VSYINDWAFCDFYGLVLPSEAQWEKAARGTDGRIYPWGDQKPTDKLCNFEWNVGNTTRVGAYPKGMSPYGLVDCAGNVYDWCADAWDSSWLKKIENGKTLNTSENRASSYSVRGGNFNNNDKYVRSAYRNNIYPDWCLYYIGFRPSQDTA